MTGTVITRIDELANQVGRQQSQMDDIQNSIKYTPMNSETGNDADDSIIIDSQSSRGRDRDRSMASVRSEGSKRGRSESRGSQGSRQGRSKDRNYYNKFASGPGGSGGEYHGGQRREQYNRRDQQHQYSSQKTPYFYSRSESSDRGRRGGWGRPPQDGGRPYEEGQYGQRGQQFLRKMREPLLNRFRGGRCGMNYSN